MLWFILGYISGIVTLIVLSALVAAGKDDYDD